MSDTANLTVRANSEGFDQVRKEGNATKQSLINNVQDIGNAHVALFNDRVKLEQEWLVAATIRAKELRSVELAQNEAISRSFRDRKLQEAKEDKIAFAQYKSTIAEKKLAIVELNRAESAAAAESIKRTRDIERAKVAAARASAAAERASSNNDNRGFKVGVGALAGNGISIGGLASVSPMAAGTVAAAYAIKNVSQDLLANATVWEKFKVALTDIEGSAGKAELAISDLYELAKRPGLSLKEAEQTYLQFRALGMEGEKAKRVIAAISNAVALSGGGSEEFGRVNLQITQMLSKGKVLEEDLRVMRNSMPRLTSAMREAFGTTTAEGIRKSGVNAEQFLAKIVTQFEKLPKATQTLESAQENAATAMSRLKAELVPDAAVKGTIEGWTALLEKAAAVAKAAWHPVATVNSAYEDFKKTMVEAGSITPEDLEKAKSGQVKYGISVYDQMHVTANEGDRANSYAAYQQSLLDAKKKEAPPDKALKNLRIENEKLSGQLAGQTKYEQEKLSIVREYQQKIEESTKAEEKGLLKKQEGLRLAILLKQHKKEEAEATRAVSSETEKLIAQVGEIDQFQQKRNALEESYKLKIEKANELGDKELVRALKRQEVWALELADKEKADALDKASVATQAMLVQNDTSLGDFQKQRLALQISFVEKLKEEHNEQLKLQLIEQNKSERAAIEYKAREAGKDLSVKYGDGIGLDKLALEYEREHKIIMDATYATYEERDRVIKSYNDKYLRDQAAIYTQLGTTVASAGQSMFGDFASSYKMGVDYRYNIEKANIERTYKLNGLSGQARIAQQSKLDDALQNLDEKRQSQMEGTYMTMFMISKGFALAESVLKLNLAIVEAAASGPFPANIAAMAAVAASVGNVVSNIAAINYAGAYDKGGDIPAGMVGMVGERGYELVTGPAHVTSTKDTAALLAGAGRAPTVTVHNYSGQGVKVQQGADPGSIEVIVGEVSRRVEEQLATGVRSGRGNLQSAIKETYSLSRRGA